MNQEPDINSEEFKKAFWDWFDNILSEQERKAFYECSMDKVKTYFFNNFFSKKEKN